MILRACKVSMSIFLAGLMGNASLIIYTVIMDAFTSTHIVADSSFQTPSDLNDCCVQLCNRSQGNKHAESANMNDYAEIANRMPHLDPSYHDMLIRLGTDLRFDLRTQCPSDSLMLARSGNFTPEHLNCPTLFLVGARKGGTSSLYQYISKHPDFEGTRLDAGPKVGETFYFSNYYEKRSWESYISVFPPDGVMTGDSSVGNLVHPVVPKRLYKTCGKQAKVVMLFRDPIKRLESNFLMRSRLGIARVKKESSISIATKIALDQFFGAVLVRTMDINNLPREWSKLVGLFPPASNLIFEGLYYVHLLNWLCNFPAENILIINSEEFYQNTNKVLDFVFQFLELKSLDSDTYDWITSATYNKGNHNYIPSYQKLSNKDITNLLGVYKPFNRMLLELLQWEHSKWTS